MHTRRKFLTRLALAAGGVAFAGKALAPNEAKAATPTTWNVVYPNPYPYKIRVRAMRAKQDDELDGSMDLYEATSVQNFLVQHLDRTCGDAIELPMHSVISQDAQTVSQVVIFNAKSFDPIWAAVTDWFQGTHAWMHRDLIGYEVALLDPKDPDLHPLRVEGWHAPWASPASMTWQRQVYAAKGTGGSWDGNVQVYDVDRKKKTKRLVARVFAVKDNITRGDGRPPIYFAMVTERRPKVPLPTDREPTVEEHLLAETGYAFCALTNDQGRMRFFNTPDEAKQAAEDRFYLLHPYLKP